jgi:hypothetical protein
MLPLRPRGLPISELGLPPKLLERVTADDVISDTFDLRCLHPDALRQEWKLTTAHFERINAALAARGMKGLEMPEGASTKAKHIPTCERPGRVEGEVCGLTKMKGRRVCAWHWMMTLPIAKQIQFADERGQRNRAIEGHVERMRVPESEWPAGGRWCSECQQFVPWIYVTGTKCKAHASRASHESMVKRVYQLEPGEYEKLLAWQKGRCYICGQLPQSQRLAVDHDHITGEVRGLLCANDAWGCNVSLRRLLNNLAIAQRALEYVTYSPLRRMRDEMGGPTELPAQEERATTDAWNPFAATG